MENGFESFNGRLREEGLIVEWFTSLEEARLGSALWRDHYNHRRPHSGLDDRSPAVFARVLGIQEKRFALFHAKQTNSTRVKGSLRRPSPPLSSPFARR